MSAISKVDVVIAAGGSGGHIFPALHIASALQETGINKICFIGVGRPAEDTIFNKYDYQRHIVATGGLKQGGLLALFKFLINAPRAFIKTWRLMRQLKPKVVVATGGYSAFYPVLVAFLQGIPSIIHEAENKFGVANRVLAIIATRVTLAFQTAKVPFWARAVYTGHPIRKSLEFVRRQTVLTQAPRKILLMGGSQGANAIDHLGLNLVDFFQKHQIEIWHQCRSENLRTLQESYQNKGVPAKVETFIHDIDQAFGWSDIIISRAGAGTVSEIAVVNRPAIFIPLPNAQGDHQSFNASTLVAEGRAFIVKEAEENFIDKVQENLSRLLELDFYNLSIQSGQSVQLGAASKIAQLAMKLGVLNS